jgi:zinc transporter
MTSDALPRHSFSHGTGEHGLICGFRFAPGEAAQPIESLGAGAAVLQPPPGGFVWLHLNLSHAGTEPWLRAHAVLGEGFFDALTEGSRSTRIERDGDELFAVMNDVTFDFSFDAGDVATLWLAVGRDRVISARRHPLRAVDRLRTDVRRGERLDSSVSLLDHLLGDQADELQRIVRRAADRLDDIEDALLAGRHQRHSSELARMRRLAVRLQRLLAPEPSALARTLSHPPAWVAPGDLEHLNRARDEFGLVLRDVAALQDRVKLMQDEVATRVAEENNASLYTLTMVTVLALPINLTAGLMGMNVGGVPLAEHPRGFWLTLLLIGAMTALIAWIALRGLRSRQQ